MRIVVFSMGPLFPDVIHGGSQKTLQAVLRYLGAEGHDCSVLCTQRDDNAIPFNICPNVQVKPILRFKQTYPEPYYTAVYNLRDAVLDLRREIESADAFYIHDSELLFHFLYDDVPTVVGLQDFVYPDTLAGVFGFRRDRLVLPSNYVKACVETIFSEIRIIDGNSLIVAPNGFDLDHMYPSGPAHLPQWLGLTGEEVLLLYPHRPDPRKGLMNAIEAVAACRTYLPSWMGSKLRLAIPRWLDSNIVPESDHIYQRLYADATQRALDLGVPDLLLLHPWLPAAWMPHYYSMGRATLCIGCFIESFGNASVESELCGTPAIVSQVGAQRSVLPDDLVYKVSFGDIDAAAQRLAEAILKPSSRSAEVRDYVHRNYSMPGMVEGYASAILTAKRSPPATELPPQRISMDDMIAIPPWCSFCDSGYYNDYAYGYSQSRVLLEFLQAATLPRPLGQLLKCGVTQEQIVNWIAQGYLVRTMLSSHGN